jgi:imidazolonepropionase
MLIQDISRLYVVPPGPRVGGAMREVPIIEDAALLVADGRIAWFGRESDTPSEVAHQLDGGAIVSADGGCVIPGLIDCHTHIPFAGDRVDEFMRRIGGATYLSILESGGGIRATTAAVREATIDQLVDENVPRLERMLSHGVTTCECKSGYGLSPEQELKQLHAIRELRHRQPIELIATYLGAHAVPEEFDGRPDDFLAEITAPELLHRIAHEKLARFCDVFCDRGAFDVSQARSVLTAARRAGLLLKIHADELAQLGASRLAGELRCVSADHLETIDESGIAALRNGGVVPVALPGTSFFLGIPHCNARKLIAAGLPVALATDCNPGSSHIESLELVMNLACCQLRLLPLEALVACTANAAAAIAEQHRLGAIAREYDADLVILDAGTVEEWMYTPGRPRIRTVVKRGQIVYSA